MSNNNSAFKSNGLKKTIENLKTEIKDLYLEDEIPWIVGYSGGKDSTAVLQLIWSVLTDLPSNVRSKPVHVISTDTLVENPIVAKWMTNSHHLMKQAATQQTLPIIPHLLTPALHDTFWVNLIGRGYPAPKQKFRWCTDRLKIKASNTFIHNIVKSNGETIVILGTRKAESASRSQTMKKYEKKRVRNRLSPNSTLPNSLIFSPIEDWSNDDVWLYLMQIKNPWGNSNKNLLTMYQGASADSECPLVVGTDTPSCGSSRFGCWTCTLVDKDKSMAAMIQNDEEKSWMLPLLKFRDELGQKNDKYRRDFRRMHGAIQLYNGNLIHGPYTQETREKWLRKLLEIQKNIQNNGPKEFSSLELITLGELKEIRRIWTIEKHEIEDNLPRIYSEVMGIMMPQSENLTNLPFASEDMSILKDLCGSKSLKYQLIRELIDVENKFKNLNRRTGLFKTLEKAFTRSFYEDDNDAYDKAHRKLAAMEAAELGTYISPLSNTRKTDGSSHNINSKSTITKKDKGLQNDF